MILYFIPGVQTLTPQLLAEHGLGNVIDASVSRHSSVGPAGSGLLVTNRDNLPENPTYDPDSQIWQRRFGSEHAWIGRLKEVSPRPAMFQRAQMIPGQPVKLSDGHAYSVPLLRSFDAQRLDGPLVYQCNLDQTLEQDPETGHLVPGDVTPQYAEVWDTAISIGDHLLAQITGGKTPELPDAQLLDFAADVLSLNYRLQKPELSLLKLLTISQAVRVMQLALDWDTLRANLKNRLRRRASGGTDSPSGKTQPNTVASTPTDPPSPN